ncbi:TPA: hypothetical protein MYM04_004033 [Klebsiella pneumoniae]|uniref:hypothetical protein n=1 Tax=Klebsiella sp. K4-74 TaxID=2920180 RepID=UPI00236CC305|nr:hypothetical protein [Klebsiella sp. K4-74]HBR4177518.1 hypothetical protein [Klebsiella pneumoniae]MDK1919785.1 hypothetical protein [Klebsiella sp. K4-74]HBR4230838.1 hypothetical protein [Klebsiella pneumoniae]HBR4986849.1 hypothetical protein [Klebsiella pneumoniae]HBS6304385.1 hypothetical protein [Klebsiella pneumoniae]
MEMSEQKSVEKRKVKAGWLVALGLVVVLPVVAATKLSIFVVAPIGAIPEGKTVIMWKSGQVDMNFIESPEGMCLSKRSFSAWCSLGAMNVAVAGNKILLRLPYSATLYNASVRNRL